MTNPLESELDRLRPIGERNLEFIRLINNHCSHAEIEAAPFMGQGIGESLIGLPVNARTIRCEHASIPAGGAMRLDWVAVEFYRANCQGCAHRDPHGWPTLADHVAELDAKEAALKQAEEDHARVELAAREERRKARVRLLANEPYPSQGIGLLLDEMDGEAGKDAAEKLVTVARSAPQFFTRAVVVALEETIQARPSGRALEALRQLVHSGQVPVAEGCAIAMAILPNHMFTEAANFVIDFAQQMETADLRKVLPTLVLLSSSRPLPFERPPEPAPLLAAARRDLFGVLEVLEQWLASDDVWRRANAAGAAEHVITVEPAVAPVLAGQLLQALGREQGMSLYDEESPALRIRSALGAAVRARPAEVRDLFAARVHGLSLERRGDLMAAYDQAVRGERRGDPVEPALANVVVPDCIARLSGDWGDDAAREAAELLERLARYNPAFLVGSVHALLAVLIRDADPASREPSPLLDPRVDPLKELEAMSRDMGRSFRLRRVRDILGLIAVADPEALAGPYFTLLGERDITDAGIDRARAELTEMLGGLGKIAALLPRVVPALYTALLGTDTLTRACAVRAWAEIAEERKRKLPSELLDLLPALLADKYVIVHKAVVRALGTITVRDDQVDMALAHVMGWANTHHDDMQFANDAIWVTRGLASRTKSDDLRLIADATCLDLADHVSVYDLSRFLRWTFDDLGAFPRFSRILLKALGSRELVGHHYDDEDQGLHALLWRVPPKAIARLVDDVRKAARLHLPMVPHRAIVFVEALQQAGLWGDAERLADEIVAAVPVTAEYGSRRSAAEVVSRGARLEAAIHRCDRARAVATLAEVRAVKTESDEDER